MKTITIDDYIDKTIGLKGTEEREKFETQLKKEVEAFFNKKTKTAKLTDTSSSNRTKSFYQHRSKPL